MKLSSINTVLAGLAFGSLIEDGLAQTPLLSSTAGSAKPNFPRAGCFQLTEAKTQSRGAVWSCKKIKVDKDFDISATVFVGVESSTNEGADGITFAFQANSPTALGNDGGDLGYYGIQNVFAVELDTFYNNGHDATRADSIEVARGNPPRTVLKTKDIPNAENGNEHTMRVKWDASSEALSVWFNSTLMHTTTIAGGLAPFLGGSTTAYYGHTASTGSRINEHYVCPGITNVVVEGENMQGGGCGDPHFKTWSGEKYDFHGVCDLVLLQNPEYSDNLGMDIHIRTVKTRMWSYIKTAAIRIGEDVLEVMGGKDEKYWINHVEGEDVKEDAATLPTSLAGHPIHFKRISEKARQFVIELENEQMIDIKTWNDMVSINVVGNNEDDFGHSLGLMGTFGDGLKVGRDNHTVHDNVNAFGMEWQVNAAEPTLFKNMEGPQAPETCQIPSEAEMRRRLGESIISKEDAELACSRVSVDNFDLCVFDVLATNDKGTAGAY